MPTCRKPLLFRPALHVCLLDTAPHFNLFNLPPPSVFPLLWLYLSLSRSVSRSLSISRSIARSIPFALSLSLARCLALSLSLPVVVVVCQGACTLEKLSLPRCLPRLPPPVPHSHCPFSPLSNFSHRRIAPSPELPSRPRLRRSRPVPKPRRRTLQILYPGAFKSVLLLAVCMNELKKPLLGGLMHEGLAMGRCVIGVV